MITVSTPEGIAEVADDRDIKMLEDRFRRLEDQVRKLRHVLDLIEAVLRNTKD